MTQPTPPQSQERPKTGWQGWREELTRMYFTPKRLQEPEYCLKDVIRNQQKDN